MTDEPGVHGSLMDYLGQTRRKLCIQSHCTYPAYIDIIETFAVHSARLTLPGSYRALIESVKPTHDKQDNHHSSDRNDFSHDARLRPRRLGRRRSEA